MISGQLLEYLDGKKTTHARLEASLGKAYPLTLRCLNADGCEVEHVYHSAACNLSVGAASEAVAQDGAFPLRRHLRPAEDATVLLCGSDHWLDGVRVGAAVRAATPLARVTYRTSEGEWSRLPYAPLLSPPSPLASTSVSMTRRQIDEDDVSLEWWSAGQAGASTATPCARGVYPPAPVNRLRAARSGGRRGLVDAEPELGVGHDVGLGGEHVDPEVDAELDAAEEEEGDDDDDDEWESDAAEWQDEIARGSGVMCYQLRLESLGVVMEVEEATSFLGLLDDWGGAYAFVFGFLALAAFSAELLGRALCGARRRLAADAFHRHEDDTAATLP